MRTNSPHDFNSSPCISARAVAPYLQGALPGPPVPEPAFPQQATALWTIDEKDKPVIQQVESSGDPILDSLRQQLRDHGADGILGLARKFRIMDDDNRSVRAIRRSRDHVKLNCHCN